MTQEPLHYLSLTRVAELIASGELRSVDVTRSLLERIAKLEPRLHAYITVMAAQALNRAAEMDARQDRGESLGPLHGVPIAVKDLCHTIGAPTTGGHRFRRDSLSDMDATVVSRLEAAGAVILGKLATTEGAMLGYHRDFQVPRNPWGDLDRWPGVSSGGSGVATAAGLCFGSLGTDTGGSIRFPSAANGIVGLKPTWGRVSRHGVLDLAPSLDHVGPMTRSVRDAARLLSVIAGPDPQDPTSLTAAAEDYEADIEQGVAGLRIGWDEAFATTGVDQCVADALKDAVATLARLGATIVNLKVPVPQVEDTPVWFVLASSEAAAVHEATFPAQKDEYGAYFRTFLETGRQVTGVDRAKASIARLNASGRLADVFREIDLLLCPTLASESFQYNPEEAYEGIDNDKGTMAGVPVAWLGRSTPFVASWDFNGYPTLSVPCGFSPNDIPLSLQLIGEPLSEALLCRAGYAYEQAYDFHARHPMLL